MATKTFTQFRVDNVVTTLPTTLQYGQEVYYKDASGNLTLWVGHEDGTAWPAVGYKRLAISIADPSTGSFTTQYSDFASFTLEKQSGQGAYYIRGNAELSGQDKTIINFSFIQYSGGVQSAGINPVGGGPDANVWKLGTLLDGTLTDFQARAHIIVYP